MPVKGMINFYNLSSVPTIPSVPSAFVLQNITKRFLIFPWLFSKFKVASGQVSDFSNIFKLKIQKVTDRVIIFLFFVFRKIFCTNFTVFHLLEAARLVFRIKAAAAFKRCKTVVVLLFSSSSIWLSELKFPRKFQKI